MSSLFTSKDNKTQDNVADVATDREDSEEDDYEHHVEYAVKLRLAGREHHKNNQCSEHPIFAENSDHPIANSVHHCCRLCNNYHSGRAKSIND